MARDRDATIEQAVSLYIRMLIPLIDEGESVIVATEEGAKVGTVSKLDADWEFYATDGGGTPLTDVVKKQQLIQLFPVLSQLGIPPEKIRAEVVRLFDLPEDFNETAPVPTAAPVATPAGPPPPQAAPQTAQISDVIGGV